MTKSNYGGLQTLHNDIDTVVLQLNITKEFEEELKSSLTDLEFEIWKVFHKSISNPARGHPTIHKKTIAWVRLTPLLDQSTIIVEEIQSDVINNNAQKVMLPDVIYELPKSYGYIPPKERSTRAFKVLEKVMGLWELAALSAVKKYAKQHSVTDIYMVSSAIKAITAGREEFIEGNDSALVQIYEKVPALAGFSKVPYKELPNYLQKVLDEIKSKSYMWHCNPDSLRVASASIRLSRLLSNLAKLLTH
jgi:hypothetical protein